MAVIDSAPEPQVFRIWSGKNSYDLVITADDVGVYRCQLCGGANEAGVGISAAVSPSSNEQYAPFYTAYYGPPAHPLEPPPHHPVPEPGSFGILLIVAVIGWAFRRGE